MQKYRTLNPPSRRKRYHKSEDPEAQNTVKNQENHENPSGNHKEAMKDSPEVGDKCTSTTSETAEYSHEDIPEDTDDMITTPKNPNNIDDMDKH